MNKYVIRSNERSEPHCYFVAIHGYSPYFSTLDKARQFDTRESATEYAIQELFTTSAAFDVLNHYQAA